VVQGVLQESGMVGVGVIVGVTVGLVGVGVGPCGMVGVGPGGFVGVGVGCGAEQVVPVCHKPQIGLPGAPWLLPPTGVVPPPDVLDVTQHCRLVGPVQ
jgi:hypothetical protein